MKLAAYIGTAQRDWEDLRSFAIEAERIGIDSLWSAEAMGHDAFTPLAFIAGQTATIGLGTGVVTVGARSAAATAMASVALASMSGGRFRLGLGANTPEIMASWHAQPFPAASKHLLETIAIVRQVASGQPLRHLGDIYNLPGRADVEAGALEPGLARDFPIYVASLSPKSLEATGLAADGWVGGASFTPSLAPVFREHIARGREKAGRDMTGFDFVAPAFLVLDADRALAQVKPFLAEQLAGVGTWRGSFHQRVYARAGMADLVARTKELFAAGKPAEAVAQLPDELALERCLVGGDEEMRVTLRKYRDCGATTVSIYWFGSKLAQSIEPLARVKALMDEVNGESGAPG